MGDLVFWVLVFLALFFGFRWLQSRKSGDDE